jgi:hypothetical protein
VLSEQSALTEANLLVHLPASPTVAAADTSVKVRIYYVGLDKKSGKLTQFKVTGGRTVREGAGGLRLYVCTVKKYLHRFQNESKLLLIL